MTRITQQYIKQYKLGNIYVEVHSAILQRWINRYEYDYIVQLYSKKTRM